MKIGSRNNLPIWMRFFALLLGIPLAAALLHAGFAREFHRPTALVMTAVALLVLYGLLNWRFKSRSIPVPMNREERKGERRKFDFGVALFLAAIFLVGGVMFSIIAILPPADLSSASRWLIRAASLFLGLLCLVMCLRFILHCRFLVTGKRGLTIRLGKPDSHK